MKITLEFGCYSMVQNFGFGRSSSEQSRMRDRESLTRGMKVIMEKKYETKSPLEGIGIKHW